MTLLLPAAVAVTTTSLGAVVAVVTTAGFPTSTRWSRGSVRITTEWPTSMCRTWFPPVLSAGAGCCAAGSVGSFCGAAGEAGTCATAGPQRPKLIKAQSASRQCVVPWTCRMASFALFRLYRKFGNCCLAVHQRLYRVDVRQFHRRGDLFQMFHFWLSRLFHYSRQPRHVDRRDIRIRRVSTIAQYEMDGALVLRQSELFRLFRAHQQRDYVYVLGLAIRIGVHLRSGRQHLDVLQYCARLRACGGIVLGPQ